LSLLQRPLMRQKPRNDGLPMKNTENADRPISAMLYSVSRRGPLIRQTGADVFQVRHQGIQNVHGSIESER
jgi:hypothetical protein